MVNGLEDIDKDKIENERFFYDGYLIVVIESTGLSNGDKDLLLATFGLLDGYYNLERKERQTKYMANVGKRKEGKDMPLSECWGDQYGSLRSRVNTVVMRLGDIIQEKISKNDSKKLNYSSDAHKMVDELKQKSYPKPYYLRNGSYRECCSEGKVFYIPYTESELRKNEVIKSKNEGSYNQQRSVIGSELTNILESKDNTNKNDQTIETPQSDNIESENTIKQTDESKHSLNKKRFFCIAIAMIILIVPKNIIINHYTTINYPTREPYKKPDLPAVESLQATEDTIRIKAGERHLVKIDVEPFETLDLLRYYSSDRKLLVVSDNGVIQAATDWSEDTIPEADIFIHAKNKIIKIHVIVYK